MSVKAFEFHVFMKIHCKIGKLTFIRFREDLNILLCYECGEQA